MIKGKTKTGFKYELADDALNDWELLKALREIDKGKQDAIVDVAPLLLGEEQTEALESHCRENGKIKLDKIFAEITDILTGAQKTKNSSTSPEQ